MPQTYTVLLTAEQHRVLAQVLEQQAIAARYMLEQTKEDRVRRLARRRAQQMDELLAEVRAAKIGDETYVG